MNENEQILYEETYDGVTKTEVTLKKFMKSPNIHSAIKIKKDVKTLDEHMSPRAKERAERKGYISEIAIMTMKDIALIINPEQMSDNQQEAYEIRYNDNPYKLKQLEGNGYHFRHADKIMDMYLFNGSF